MLVTLAFNRQGNQVALGATNVPGDAKKSRPDPSI